MDKTKNIHLTHLRNDEHFQFFTDVVSLVNSVGAGKLNVQKQFDALCDIYREEDEALKKILKSALTDRIAEADAARDALFSGMAETNRAAQNHFTPAVREAAVRLQIVFNTYGNVAAKADAEETSAIHNLLLELTQKHAADMTTVGLTPWAEELQTRNTAVQILMSERYDENASRTVLVLKTVRKRLDEAYRKLVARIDAAALFEAEDGTDSSADDGVEGGIRASGDAALPLYAGFIRRLNAIITRANDILAHRRGKGAKSPSNLPEREA